MKIEWTDQTWNPIRARNKATGKVGWHCTHVSEGCRHCYAETMNKWRGTGLPFAPASQDKIELFLDEKILERPLHWKKPRKVFVCDMTDLFGEWVPDEWIEKMLAVMAVTPQITYQILTKRPERMRRFFTEDIDGRQDRINSWCGTFKDWDEMEPAEDWPDINLWLGVSCEDQKTANERIPVLLQTPAAVRWVSCEPMLGPVDFTRLCGSTLDALDGHDFEAIGDIRDAGILSKTQHPPKLDWIIFGGESGRRARPCDVAWIRSGVQQCRAAGVKAFVKQIGSNPVSTIVDHEYGGSESFCWAPKHPKGGDPAEWPEELRVREFPR